MNDSLLRQLMSAIVEGDDSLAAARKLELLLVENYAETELFETLTEPLSLYRPGGGTHYYGASEVQDRVGWALAHLDNLLSTAGSEE